MRVWAILLTLVTAQTVMAFHPSGVTASLQTTFSKAVAGDDASEKRIIKEANDDAMAFLSTEGETRGVHLEAALIVLRKNHPDMTTKNDADIAAAIVEANRVYNESLDNN